MSSTKALNKKKKELELTKAYAEFKVRTGDLGPEFNNWIDNIEKSLESLKEKK